nr:MAG TPA: hypothetical protein [Caudoviricetes sp.]
MYSILLSNSPVFTTQHGSECSRNIPKRSRNGFILPNLSIFCLILYCFLCDLLHYPNINN